MERRVGAEVTDYDCSPPLVILANAGINVDWSALMMRCKPEVRMDSRLRGNDGSGRANDGVSGNDGEAGLTNVSRNDDWVSWECWVAGMTE
ncbi:hypothetical protein DT594_17745 [Halopseudomonas laoshanensis]|uniref:Uncharacterized protein n=1 Tax=Halopseudomonas laoshanensis TaxID=2268758 RepID=A0A7V7GQI2_9GAMM|nr:hypothetical protein DT594_17745 [Halopseudomonas laoshanensis]